jgi:hypothetical protein
MQMFQQMQMQQMRQLQMQMQMAAAKAKSPGTPNAAGSGASAEADQSPSPQYSIGKTPSNVCMYVCTERCACWSSFFVWVLFSSCCYANTFSHILL